MPSPIALTALVVHDDDEAIDFSTRALARMTAEGVRFLEEPRHEAYGSVAVFEDLYGNRRDLLQSAASAPAPA